MKRVPFKTLGAIICPWCGKASTLKTSKKGTAYFNCNNCGRGKGGDSGIGGIQVMARGDDASIVLMSKVVEWHSDASAVVEQKDGLKNWPPKTTKPASAAPPASPPPTPPAKKPATSFWDKPIL